MMCVIENIQTYVYVSVSVYMNIVGKSFLYVGGCVGGWVGCVYVSVCVCVCAVSYTHLTLPTRRTV